MASVSLSADMIVPQHAGFVGVNKVGWPSSLPNVVNKSYMDFKTASGTPYDHVGTISGTTITATVGLMMPTVGGTPTLLDDYERVIVAHQGLTEDVIAPDVVDLYFDRVGRRVTLSWNFGSTGMLENVDTIANARMIVTVGALNLLPVRMLPPDPVTAVLSFNALGYTPMLGKVTVDRTTGIVFAYPLTTSPHLAIPVTFYNESITYSV